MRPMIVSILAVLAAIVAWSACAPKTVAVPVVTTPNYPDFVRPVPPPALAASPAARLDERAWLFLQAGELRSADREAAAALESSPDFYPAETTAGYVHLAQREFLEAIGRFDRALSRRQDYAPALAGKGQALLAVNREEDALDVFQSALAADPSLSDVGRRVEVLRFRVAERTVTAARDAVRAGHTQQAMSAYRQAIERSPDSAFLYRERAVIEREAGDVAAAMEDLRKAVSLDPTDVAALGQLGDLLDAQGDAEGALNAYGDALVLRPDPSVVSKRDALRARMEAMRLPVEYRAIDDAARITRGDLAALVGIRLGALLAVGRPRDAGVLTDIRNHWAERWILAAARGGVLDPFANHTFQPGAIVRRVDLAQVVTRLLAHVAAVAPAQAQAWSNARGTFSDLGTGHLAYPAASAAVASGAMGVGADRAFQPTQPVTGAEAIQAMTRLKALAQIAPDGSLPVAAQRQ